MDLVARTGPKIYSEQSELDNEYRKLVPSTLMRKSTKVRGVRTANTPKNAFFVHADKLVRYTVGVKKCNIETNMHQIDRKCDGKDVWNKFNLVELMT